MAHIENFVLDIPVPKSVISMATVPPFCLGKVEDLHVLDLIKDFGQEFDCCRGEITHALNLASGPSDVMIVLERPSKSHDYTVTAEEFIRQCTTLRAVDELIKISTKGSRSIYNVSVVDAFMFKPKNRLVIPDQRCHQLLAQMIRLKRPKVLLLCHTESYSDPWMHKFELPCNNGYRMSHEVIPIGETEIHAVQSFHPSGAVYYKRSNPEYKALLLHHFVAAFSLLHGPYNEPSVVETIRSICAKNIRNYRLKSWEAADRISKALDPRSALTGSRRLASSGETERDRITREKESFDDMYQRLLQLSEFAQPIGALSISVVVVHLWKSHFRSHPLYRQVMTMLVSRGNEQECWLPNKTHALHAEAIESTFSRMNLKDTQISPDSFDQSISDRDSAVVSNASNTHAHCPEERQMLKQQLRRKADPTLLQKMIEYVEEDCLIEKHLTKRSIYNLGSSLRICRLVSQIRFQIEILRLDDYNLKDVEDFLDASDRLEQLIMQFPEKAS